MRTEADARELWCPFSRAEVNRGKAVSGAEHVRCIASDCAAWRWAYRFEHVETGEGIHFEPKQGYCGLAGRP